MDARHDLSIFTAMDNSGHPNSQQLRPPSYTDLCRPSGAPADHTSTLSAAYHSRYLASLPLAPGSNFPFLGGSIFSGSSSPATSFRAPSAPVMSSMRQFWPPTPPPDGYGRYGMNTSLFPLFGSVSPSPDAGTYMTQGLVSRLSTAGHLPHLIENHKDQGFFSPGFNLVSPLTPSSHVTSTTTFPHMIPSLEKHPGFIPSPLPSKGLEECRDLSDPPSSKDNVDPYKHDRYSSMSTKSKTEKHYDKPDQKKSASKEKQSGRRSDSKHNLQSPTKISPCEIDISCSPSIKPDILSPPLDSPKSDVPQSPKSAVKRQQDFSPMNSPPLPPTSAFSMKLESQCSTCAANIKGVGIATKLRGTQKKPTAVHPSVQYTAPSEKELGPNPPEPFGNVPPVVSTWTTVATCSPQTVSVDSSNRMLEAKKPTCATSSCLPLKSQSPRSNSANVSQDTSLGLEKPSASTTISSVSVSVSKHVTAAVIPTAPKQLIQRDLVTHQPYSSLAESNYRMATVDNRGIQKIKSELDTTNVDSSSDKGLHPSCATVNDSYNLKSTPICKVKDMIKEIEPQNAEPSTPIEENSKAFEVKPSSLSVCSANIEYDSMKTESSTDTLDCKPQTTPGNWMKATVSPFNWQKNWNTVDDQQAMNLTVSKASKIETSSPLTVKSKEDGVCSAETVKITTENVSMTNTGIIGVCHPNSKQTVSAMNTVNRFPSTATATLPEITAEVHVTSKSSLQAVRMNPTPPNVVKTNTASVQGRVVKSERVTIKKGKISDIEKVLPSSRGTLATLAPKLGLKKVGFLKDAKTSNHMLSTSSSMSSTSIVFPPSVNPCIPVGIAIAQQRQDSSTAASIGKTQSSIQSSAAGIVPSTAHVNHITAHSNHITAELQSSQEVLRDQKQQDIITSTAGISDSTNILVTPGPTILSRQWESEAVTRATLPSPWVSHAPIVAPALWIGQGAYATTAATPTSATVPPLPPPSMTPVEPSPISLPPGGYQLARDSLTGHLFLIPSANIVERTPMWPSYNAPTPSTLPIQQLVTQQHHTQFEQVLPPQVSEAEPVQDCLSLTVQQMHMGETTKEINADNCSTSNSPMNNYKLIEQNGKTEEKTECNSAANQAFAFTTFPPNCDPSSFSYVLQSSTVMHLAHTQTTTSIQTESEKRSQGTSPLHCATPSPTNCMVDVMDNVSEEDNDSDVQNAACSEVVQSQSVTTAIQVDMDCQTNSEEDEEESSSETLSQKNVEMSDSAIQTEIVSDSGKCDSASEYAESSNGELLDKDSSSNQAAFSFIDPKADLRVVAECPLSVIPTEIISTETELAPSLPVESKPVMDFIDHHGLNLLVDSIEEFASREKGELEVNVSDAPTQSCDKSEKSLEVENHGISVSFQDLDTPCTDGLGLLCALAEQRFLEESLNTNNQTEQSSKELSPSRRYMEKHGDGNTTGSENFNYEDMMSNFQDPFASASAADLRACELEMRKRLADLQKKYKEKELELARLMPNGDVVEDNAEKLLETERENYSKKKAKLLPANYNRKPAVPRSRHCFSSQSQRMLMKKSLLHKKKYTTFGKSAMANKKKHLESSKKPQDASSSQSKSTSDFSSDSKKRESENDLKAKKICKKISKPSPAKKSKLNDSFFKQETIKSAKKRALKVKDSKVFKDKKCGRKGFSGHWKSTNLSKRNIPNKRKNKNAGHPKVPFFDEQAWFIRRSERIFLSDARPPVAQQPPTTPKKLVNSTSSSSTTPIKKDTPTKDTKESYEISQNIEDVAKLNLDVAKDSIEDEDVLRKKDKVSKKLKSKSSVQTKKRHVSESSNISSRSSISSISDSESCSESSSQSDNVPLIRLIEQASGKEKCAASTIDNDNSDASSALSEDIIPLSALIEKKTEKVEVKSCILSPSDLQEGTRILILDEGLLYAGHITAIQAPDVYGIILDGERAHRPHIFSREEILNAAVLEIKPDRTSQLPEGCRVCAYWSQQYRCLYPGKVAKATSPLPDPSLVFVEFDDGDSGRIPLDDIRLLPPEFFPISAPAEPNPLLILGKRKARLEREGNNNDQRSSSSTFKVDTKESKSTPDAKKRKLDHSGDKDTKKESDSSSPSNTKISRNESDEKSSSLKAASSKSKHSSKSSQKGRKTDDNTRHKLAKDRTENSLDSSSSSTMKPKKHKKRKDDHKHHHRHHHHHHKHHHKKHKIRKQNHLTETDSSAENTVISVDSCSDFAQHAESHKHILCAEQKSELTMTITTSPPHMTHDQELANKVRQQNGDNTTFQRHDSSIGTKKPKKNKNVEQNKPAKRKDRLPSVEKSKIAAFLPVRQLWRWSGKSYCRSGIKGKAKKEFYRAIQRGKETLWVGDCAVFLSTGKPNFPYIGRIESMWESWGGKMGVKVKWFYHPEETNRNKKLTQLKKGALFQSPHCDENDVQTISHKCKVLSWSEYSQKKDEDPCSSLFDSNGIYYLAGTYDPFIGTLSLEPDVPKIPALNSQEG